MADTAATVSPREGAENRLTEAMRPEGVSVRRWAAIMAGRPLYPWPVTIHVEPTFRFAPRVFCDNRTAREWIASWPRHVERRWRTFRVRIGGWYVCLTVAWWRDGISARAALSAPSGAVVPTPNTGTED